MDTYFEQTYVDTRLPKCPVCRIKVPLEGEKCTCPECYALLKFNVEKQEYKKRLCKVLLLKGRMGRLEFFLNSIICFVLIVAGIFLTRFLINNCNSYEEASLFVKGEIVLFLLCSIRYLMCRTMRMEDAGFSPYFQFIPVIGMIIIPFFHESSYNDNSHFEKSITKKIILYVLIIIYSSMVAYLPLKKGIETFYSYTAEEIEQINENMEINKMFENLFVDETVYLFKVTEYESYLFVTKIKDGYIQIIFNNEEDALALKKSLKKLKKQKGKEFAQYIADYGKSFINTDNVIEIEIFDAEDNLRESFNNDDLQWFLDNQKEALRYAYTIYIRIYFDSLPELP